MHIELLVQCIRERGPIATARVSSAKARGHAKNYSYWGVARYRIHLGADGAPVNVAVTGAGSDRRSMRLVEQDCDALCVQEGRIRLQTIGKLNEADAASVLAKLDCDPKKPPPPPPPPGWRPARYIKLPEQTP